MLNVSLAGVSYSYLIFVIKCRPNRHALFFASTTGVNRALLRRPQSSCCSTWSEWWEKGGWFWNGFIVFPLTVFDHITLIPIYVFELIQTRTGFSYPWDPSLHRREPCTRTGTGTGQLNITRGDPVSITIPAWRYIKGSSVKDNTTVSMALTKSWMHISSSRNRGDCDEKEGWNREWWSQVVFVGTRIGLAFTSSSWQTFE